MTRRISRGIVHLFKLLLLDYVAIHTHWRSHPRHNAPCKIQAYIDLPGSRQRLLIACYACCELVASLPGAQGGTYIMTEGESSNSVCWWHDMQVAPGRFFANWIQGRCMHVHLGGLQGLGSMSFQLAFHELGCRSVAVYLHAGRLSWWPADACQADFGSNRNVALCPGCIANSTSFGAHS